MLGNFFNGINTSVHPQTAEGIVATAKTGSQGQLQSFVFYSTTGVTVIEKRGCHAKVLDINLSGETTTAVSATHTIFPAPARVS